MTESKFLIAYLNIPLSPLLAKNVIPHQTINKCCQKNTFSLHIEREHSAMFWTEILTLPPSSLPFLVQVKLKRVLFSSTEIILKLKTK